MITKRIDQGWGPDIPLRQMQQEIEDEFFQPLEQQPGSQLLINSTWYTKERHEQVLRNELQDYDSVIITSFVDPPGVRTDWFPDHLPIYEVGYYETINEIDFWALSVSRYFNIDYAVDRERRINVPFMCLNRKPHWHRSWFYRQLADHDLLDRGIVTMGGAHGMPTRTVKDDVRGSTLAANSGSGVYGINNDIMSLGAADYWNSHLLNLVTETVFEVDKIWFVSEKIYKPVLGLRPFLVVAPGGAERWLTQHGFLHYLDDWHEITDLDLRDPSNIADFLVCLAQRDTRWLQKKYLALGDKILYNRERFSVYVEEIQNRIAKGIICQI